MKIKVTNLGAIENGVIDLGKRINLFCGYNGTGKTYLAYVIYGLFRNRIIISPDDSLIDVLLKNRKVKHQIDFDLLFQYKREVLKNIKENIENIFGIGVETAENIFEGFDIDFEENDEELNKNIIEYNINETTKIQGVSILINKTNNSCFIELEILDGNLTDEALSRIKFVLKSYLYSTLLIYPVSGVDVFPVERNSIYTFSKELSIRKQEALDNLQLLIDKEKKISKFDIFFNSKRYPLPIKDGLLVAEDLSELKKNRSNFYNFAESLENELLHGKVVISNDGEIQFKPEKNSRKVLPIQMTASIVKTMSSLVVYLKHIAIKNDLIIIDEPEINLHPENQIALARILARLANNGFRLLVSTHSDYIIREFNNLVMLSNKEFKEVRQIAEINGYKDEEYIKQDDLAVYHFSYKSSRAKKVAISQVVVDRFGFGIDSIDKVIDKQNEVCENLYYTIKYKENE